MEQIRNSSVAPVIKRLMEAIMQPTGVLENSKATKNPLKELLNYGQSMWLDYIRRDLFTTGKLKQLITDDGLRGMTSNPSIFEKAIGDSSLYDDMLKSLAKQKDLDTTAKFEQIAIRDIQDAADVLRPVYEESNFRDGYVSLEVSPYLARKTQETIDEARRLWKAVDRENVMIKVPGTAEGLPAIRQVDRRRHQHQHHTVIRAGSVREGCRGLYRRTGRLGLARRESEKDGKRGQLLYQPHRHPDRLAYWATNSRRPTTPISKRLLKRLLGKVAIANGKLTYQRYQKIFSGPRWQALAAKGAQTQRVLWASTSTKNPAYRDVIYVEELIGPDTVNTMPPATIDAFRDHGVVRNSLTEDVPGAAKVMDDLATCGHFDQGSDGQTHR